MHSLLRFNSSCTEEAIDVLRNILFTESAKKRRQDITQSATMKNEESSVISENVMRCDSFQYGTTSQKNPLNDETASLIRDLQ